jgi:hypothetical protein
MNLNYRNYNPLNIRTTNIPWEGKVGNNAGFETFSSPEYGYRAAAKNLYTYNKQGLNTTRELISKWAPNNENNTEAYVQKVAKDLGVDPDANLGNLKDNPALTKNLMKSMTEHEGPQNNFTDAHVENGIALANGKPVDEVNFEPKPEDGSKFFEQDEEGKEPVYKDKIIRDAEQKDRNDAIQRLENRKKLQAGAKQRDRKLFNLSSENWCSTVDSPTYKWTFYIVNSKIFNDPSQLEGDDTAAVNKGDAIIISQTGVTTEFAMDNFAMIQSVIPGLEHGNTTPGIIQFELQEPLGFTFLDRILKAGKILGNSNSLPAQHYALKLEFVGRDPDTGGSVKYPNTFFYPIKINQVRSQTGPEGTRYNIVAFSMIKHAQTEAVTSTTITVPEVKTVQDFATNLQAKFNEAETLQSVGPIGMKKGLKAPKELKIVFDISADITGIQSKYTRSQKTIKDFALKLKPWSSKANPAKGSGSNTSMDGPQIDSSEVIIESKSALCAVIKKKIESNCPAFSSYVRKVYEETGIVYSIHVEPKIDFQLPADDIAHKKGKKTSQPAKLLTLTIKVHSSPDTPALLEERHKENLRKAKYQKQRLRNMTICKSYSYLYSGLNTEVLNYSIDVENLYVNARIPLDGIYHADGREQYTPTTPSKDGPQIDKSTTYLDQVSYGTMTDYIDLVTYVDQPLGLEEQQKGETDGSDGLYAQRLQAIAFRTLDAFQFTMEIKGDPFWQGNSFQAYVQGNDISPPPSTECLFISLLTYNPNSEDLIERQVRGPVDLISSGIYKVVGIESRFQSGKFTQTLRGIKDANANIALILNDLIELSGGNMAPPPPPKDLPRDGGNPGGF